jgi:hypothetical protein
LRERGVLIVGSGNIVHNLRAIGMSATAMQAYDWALEFDRVTADLLQPGNLAALAGFQKLGPVAQQAHPPGTITCRCFMRRRGRRERCGALFQYQLPERVNFDALGALGLKLRLTLRPGRVPPGCHR